MGAQDERGRSGKGKRERPGSGQRWGITYKGRDLTRDTGLCQGHISKERFIQTSQVRMWGQRGMAFFRLAVVKEAFGSLSYDSSQH